MRPAAALSIKGGKKAKQQLRKLRFCPAKAEAKARTIIAKVYAGAMYGVEAAGASVVKIANLTAAVIDVFKAETTITMQTNSSPP